MALTSIGLFDVNMQLVLRVDLILYSKTRKVELAKFRGTILSSGTFGMALYIYGRVE